MTRWSNLILGGVRGDELKDMPIQKTEARMKRAVMGRSREIIACTRKVIKEAMLRQVSRGVEVLMVKEARRYVRTKYDYLFVLTLPFTKLSSRHPLSNSTAVTNARVGSTLHQQTT